MKLEDMMKSVEKMPRPIAGAITRYVEDVVPTQDSSPKQVEALKLALLDCFLEGVNQYFSSHPHSVIKSAKGYWSQRRTEEIARHMGDYMRDYLWREYFPQELIELGRRGVERVTLGDIGEEGDCDSLSKVKQGWKYCFKRKDERLIKELSDFIFLVGSLGKRS